MTTVGSGLTKVVSGFNDVIGGITKGVFVRTERD